VFRNLSLRGNTGAILYGYAQAAVLQRWSITRKAADPHKRQPAHWVLYATFARVDKFNLRQRPLLFSAAREGLKGLWCWPLIEESIQISDTTLLAHLGPPEQ
jgi:hypothetical protein